MNSNNNILNLDNMMSLNSCAQGNNRECFDTAMKELKID